MNKYSVIDSKEINKNRLLIALRDMSNFLPKSNENDWFNMIAKLPESLRFSLLMEMESGNNISLIQDCDWPKKGSIIVSLTSPFKNNYKNWKNGVEFRVINDPHYWQEDIHVNIDNVEHLIIT